MHRLQPAAVAMAALLATSTARAADPFEIQVYDGNANQPGVPGVEIHLNHVASGIREAAPPELPLHRQTHATVEPSFGVTPWWELGGYLQTTLRSDGHYDYAGVKLRSKFVTPPGWHPHLRLGLNVEVSLLPDAYDRNRWGHELRPIVAWEDDLFIFAVNPIVDSALAGPDLGAGPRFAPAAMAKVKFFEAIALGVEYYSDLGPIAHPAAIESQEHYLYETFDLLAVRRFELNAGIGEGLTAASNPLVLKVILGYFFDPAPEQTPKRVSSRRFR